MTRWPWRRASPETGAEVRALLTMALPAVAQSLLQTMVFLVDRVMLGRHSAEALASMQVAGPLIWTLHSVFGSFTAGTVAVVGRSVGAGDKAGASSALRGSLLLAVMLGAMVGLGVYGLIDPLLVLLGGNAGPRVLGEAHGFLSVLLPMTPVVFVALAATNTLQAAGNTRTPFLIALATNAVSVIGNWVLIFGRLGAPRLGARGAAISNAMALSLEALLALSVLARKSSPVALRGGEGVDAVAGLKRVFAIAVGSFGERTIYHAGYMVFVRITNGLGPVAMAAHQALLSIESVSFLSADGFAVAAGARVAQRLGAGDAAGAKRVGWIAAATSAGFLVPIALGMFVGAETLIALFRDDPAIVAMGRSALRVGAVVQVPMAAAIVLAQSLRASGATREALGVALGGSFGVRITATAGFVRAMGLGLTGVWLGSGADWLARFALCAWRWQRGGWQKARV